MTPGGPPGRSPTYGVVFDTFPPNEIQRSGAGGRSRGFSGGIPGSSRRGSVGPRPEGDLFKRLYRIAHWLAHEPVLESVSRFNFR